MLFVVGTRPRNVIELEHEIPADRRELFEDSDACVYDLWTNSVARNGGDRIDSLFIRCAW